MVRGAGAPQIMRFVVEESRHAVGTCIFNTEAIVHMGCIWWTQVAHISQRTDRRRWTAHLQTGLCTSVLRSIDDCAVLARCGLFTGMAIGKLIDSTCLGHRGQPVGQSCLFRFGDVL